MYNIEGAVWISEQIKREFGDLSGRSVLEYGNQMVWQHAKPVMNTESDLARDWFVDVLKASRYECVDLNGLDGAIQIDLGDQVPAQYQNLYHEFDVVTNVGCAEHFGEDAKRQWKAFANALYFANTGGIILHQLIPAGQWEDHGDVWYKDGIGNVLAEVLHCELVAEERVNLRTINPDVDYICVCLRKTGSVFLTSDPPLKFVEKLTWKA